MLNCLGVRLLHFKSPTWKTKYTASLKTHNRSSDVTISIVTNPYAQQFTVVAIIWLLFLCIRLYLYVFRCSESLPPTEMRTLSLLVQSSSSFRSLRRCTSSSPTFPPSENTPSGACLPWRFSISHRTTFHKFSSTTFRLVSLWLSSILGFKRKSMCMNWNQNVSFVFNMLIGLALRKASEFC